MEVNILKCEACGMRYVVPSYVVGIDCGQCGERIGEPRLWPKNDKEERK